MFNFRFVVGNASKRTVEHRHGGKNVERERSRPSASPLCGPKREW